MEEKLQYKKPDVTRENEDTLHTHEDDHLYNPGDYLPCNLLDMFSQEMDDNELSYDYHEDTSNTMVKN